MHHCMKHTGKVKAHWDTDNVKDTGNVWDTGLKLPFPPCNQAVIYIQRTRAEESELPIPTVQLVHCLLVW